MAVDTVEPLFEGRGGSDDYTRHRTHTAVYEVYTDSPADDENVVGSAAGIPVLGDAHPGDADAVVVRVTASQDAADPLRWLVTVEYDTQPPHPDALQPGDGGAGAAPGEGVGAAQSVADVPDNPLSRPAVWKFGFQQTTEVLREAYQADAAGVNVIPNAKTKPVVNSAGMPFDPPVTIEVSRPIVTVTKNLEGFNLPALCTLQDSVNVSEWFGCPARTVRCVGVEAQSGFENGTAFWAYTFTFALKAEKWDIRILDCGWGRWVSVDPPLDTAFEFRAFLDANGNPRTEPTPLDGAGNENARGAPEAYLVWSAYPQVDFNALVPL